MNPSPRSSSSMPASRPRPAFMRMWLVLLGVFLTTACPLVPGVELEFRCTTTADCRSNLACAPDGVCRASCQSTSQCTAPLECLASFCQRAGDVSSSSSQVVPSSSQAQGTSSSGPPSSSRTSSSSAVVSSSRPPPSSSVDVSSSLAAPSSSGSGVSLAPSSLVASSSGPTSLAQSSSSSVSSSSTAGLSSSGVVVSSSSRPPACDAAYVFSNAYFFGATPGAFVVGEFTADSHPDVLVAFQDGTLQVQANDAAGNFTGGMVQNVGLLAVESMVAQDLTRDGRVDVVLSAPTTTQMAVVLQGAPNMLTRPTTMTGVVASGMAIADLDGNQDNELVVSSTSSSFLQTMTISDEGAVVQQVLEQVMAPGPMTVLAATGQFPTVLVGQRRASAGVVVVSGLPSNVPRNVLPLNLPSMRQLRVGDFNRDGEQEMAILLEASPWLVLASTAGAVTMVGQASQARAMAVGDMDRDGMTDIVTLTQSGGLELLHSLGTLAFTKTQVATVGPGSNALELQDVDGDGYRDILVLDPMDKTMTVLLRRCGP